MYQTYDELQHYGILGMKWGRRRSDAQLSKDKNSSEYSKKTTKQLAMLDKNLAKDMNTAILQAKNTKLTIDNNGNIYAISNKKYDRERAQTASIINNVINSINKSGEVKITSISDMAIRNGRSVVEYVLDNKTIRTVDGGLTTNINTATKKK